MMNIITKGMKRFIIILAFGFLAVSCQKPFVKQYTLAVDAITYSLSADGDTFPIYVYCTGSWSASFEDAPSWIQILPGTESGEGNSVVRVTYKDNDTAPRQANLVIRSGDRSVTISISQQYHSSRLVVI